MPNWRRAVSNPMQPSNLVRVLAGLLLALLAWQGKCLCARVDTLVDRVTAVENALTRIDTKLDMHMGPGGIPAKSGVLAGLGGGPENQRNQKSVLCP